MTALSLFLIYLSISAYTCDAYKALVVFPMASQSHANLGNGVVRQLLKDGNEVVYVRVFEYKDAPSTLRQIDVSAASKAIQVEELTIETLLEKKMDVNDYGLLRQVMSSIVIETLKIKEVKELLNDPEEHFDVVIVEWMFCEIFSGLAALFNSPLIWLAPMEVSSDILSLIDGAPNPAYSINSIASNLLPFTFSQRVGELWTRLRMAYLDYMYYDGIQADEYNTLIAPYILKRGRKPPSFYEVRYNASMILGNSHVSTGQADRLPQSYKPIGGFFIDENIKPLPQDLKNIIDSAKNGVIYFSMGSILKSKDWPMEIKQNLLKLFSKLKQTVLWKFEEDLPNVPNNVHILKWAPQPSILSHPNCMLFVTHGGMLSTTEAIHFGVPVIGIPFFGDQFANIIKVVNKGLALKVDLTHNLVEDLKEAIKEMLSKPTYRERAKELSYIYHDRPVKPAQELIHWIRHVVHTRGAAHLRSPAVDIPLYQRLYLDLLALLAIALIFILRLLKLVCNVVCPNKKSNRKNKKE